MPGAQAGDVTSELRDTISRSQSGECTLSGVQADGSENTSEYNADECDHDSQNLGHWLAWMKVAVSNGRCRDKRKIKRICSGPSFFLTDNLSHQDDQKRQEYQDWRGMKQLDGERAQKTEWHGD